MTDTLSSHDTPRKRWQAQLIEAATAADVAHTAMLDGIVLRTNGYLVQPYDPHGTAPLHAPALLVYDNNGRFVRDAQQEPMPEGAALQDTLRAIAARDRILPQVRIAFR